MRLMSESEMQDYDTGSNIRIGVSTRSDGEPAHDERFRRDAVHTTTRPYDAK